MPAPKSALARRVMLQEQAREVPASLDLTPETAKETVRRAAVSALRQNGHVANLNRSRRAALARQDAQTWARRAEAYDKLRREEKGLVALWADHGDETARNELVIRHRPLVNSLAMQVWRTNGKRGSLDDLRQVGMLALLEAAETFDSAHPKRAGFAAYAQTSVASAMTRAIMNLAGPVRIGTNIHDKRVWFRFRQIASKIEQRLGRPVNDSEIEAIAAEIDVPASAIHRMMPRMMSADRSLDECRTPAEAAPATLDREPSWTYDEGVVAASDPEAEVAAAMAREQLARALEIAMSALGNHERAILRMRWLMPTGKKVSLAQVGLVIHRAKKTVAETEQNALAKLRAALEAVGLTRDALGEITSPFIPYDRTPLMSRQ